MPASPAGPEQSRLVGRSRAYTAANLSPRLRHWHAPRVNRWEQLCLQAGTLTIECLQATGTVHSTLAASDHYWFAPGTRWRVADMTADACFVLEIHVDAKGQAQAPHPIRSRLLEETQRITVPDADAFHALLQDFPAGARCLVDGVFPMPVWDTPRWQSRALFQHPLHAAAKAFTVLIARDQQPFDLATYLGRDHAVIEAALGSALTGDDENERWMRAALERHLHIEEDLLFPAYLDAGGTPGHVHGLKNEHVLLRQHLQSFDAPDSRRKFLRLLDAHDEKEEQAVYPDIVQRLGERADTLLAVAIAHPLSDSNS